MQVLVTGGAGYIGSRTCVSLLEAGQDVTVIDNRGNSSEVALDRVQQITGGPLEFIRGDIRNPVDRYRALEGGADAVIHFSALKAVGESCEKPLDYFDNNIGGTVALLQAMRRAGVSNLVFSSSATVYGDPDRVPVTEDAPLRVTNPYGRTQLVMESLIGDCCQDMPGISAVLLRYFNPVGAHPSGLIGEDPRGTPNNLMPCVAQVAVGRRGFQVFGGDYPTPDGTGVRDYDYIHVMDLVEAHVRALEFAGGQTGARAINVGMGRGYNVLELVRAFEKASGKAVPFEIVGRRAGDVAELGLAGSCWGGGRSGDLAAMCVNAWRWQSRNPRGYAEDSSTARSPGDP